MLALGIYEPTAFFFRRKKDTRQAISEGIKDYYRTHIHHAKGLKGVRSSQSSVHLHFYEVKGS